MKKIFVALVLALALCLSLVGCGEEKSGADYVVETFENIFAGLETVQITENTRITLSVADVTSLCTMLGADAGSVPALKDAFIDLYGNSELAMMNYGVTLDDKPLNLALYSDGEKMAVTSEQLSKDYGATMEELYTLLETLMGEELPYSYADMLRYNDPAFFAALDARYGEKLETLLRENFEFTTEKDGKNVRVSFALTPENVTEFVYQIAVYFQTDTEMMDMIATMYGEEIVAEIKALELNKEDMLSSLTDSGFSGDVTLTIRKKDSKLLAADAKLIENEEPLTMQYAENENGFTATIKAETAAIDMASVSGDDTYSFTLTATEDGAEIMRMALDIAEDITFSLTADGTTIGATADYTETKTGFEATLTEIKVAGIGMDFADIGIKLAVETDVEMPVMPEEYTSIANYTAQDFQTMLMEFIVNAGLLSYMMQ